MVLRVEVQRDCSGGQACGARLALNSAGLDSQELNFDSSLPGRSSACGVVAAVSGISRIQSRMFETSSALELELLLSGLELLLTIDADVFGSTPRQNCCLLNKSDFDCRVSIKYDFMCSRCSKSV